MFTIALLLFCVVPAAQSITSACLPVVGLPAPAAAKAQLGLGHSYSRAKVKFNVHRADNMIIQSISLLDQVDKDINTFSMRIRCVCGEGGGISVCICVISDGEC